ncbi:Uncharacterised protein [Mycoplasmopsis citelli]|uniref:Uncharacterized protein n=1 Tax=Mycoplasmopsis citelli TaxID=171281 RepID=A0A449B0V0_9BACT|nr:hypothetical protein [Mycoplasmopsis citelli]VEU74239.1 Uncharacterised protein [Mycoplasmopsis citelli]
MKKRTIKISAALLGVAIPFTASASFLVAKTPNNQQKVVTTAASETSENAVAPAAKVNNPNVVSLPKVQQELLKLLENVKFEVSNQKVKQSKNASQLSKSDLKMSYSFSNLEVLNATNVSVSYDLLSSKNFKTTLTNKNMVKFVNDHADSGKAVIAVYATYRDDKMQESSMTFKLVEGLKEESYHTQLVDLESLLPVKETEEYKVVITKSLAEINKYLNENANNNSGKTSRLPIVSVQYYKKHDLKNEKHEVIEFAFGFSRYSDSADNHIFNLKKEFYDTIQLVNKNGQVDSKTKENKYILAQYNMKTGILTLFVKKKDGGSQEVKINLN